MGSTEPDERIELSILAAPSDLPFLEPTVRHLLRVISPSPGIVRRVMVLDPGDRRDAIPSRSFLPLQRLADRLCSDGALDEWRAVPWTDADVCLTMERWYGRKDAPPRARGGRARYQYAWSIDSAKEPRVLHLDSDVLFHAPEGRWLERAADLFRERSDIGAVVPMGGVPQARTVPEWLQGPKADVPLHRSGWNTGTSVTSRAVLLDRRILDERVLPLPEGMAGDQWERSLGLGFEAAGLLRYTFVEMEEYFLHPRRHNSFHVRYIEDLIALVEAGRYPYRRWGNPWDITTEGRRCVPWWLTIQRERLEAGARAWRAKARVARYRH